jgi:CelD/BcsL family acetyltransferase involved in cellulose biosynthesis
VFKPQDAHRQQQRSIWLPVAIITVMFLLSYIAIDGRVISPAMATAQTIPVPIDNIAAHPRLFFQAADLPRLRDNRNEAYREIWRPILRYTDSQLGAVPSPTVLPDTPLEQFRNYGDRLIPFAFACVMTGRDDHCALAKSYLLAYAGWEHWGDNGRRGLGQAHMLIGNAIAYDWLHTRLSPTERQIVRENLARWAHRMYEASAADSYDDVWQNWWRKSYMQNHYWTTHAALGLAGLALLGEDDNAHLWVDHATQKLARGRDFLNGIGDGSWHESIGYQGLILSTSLPFLVSLRNVTGVDILPHDYLQNYVYWMLYNQLPGTTEMLFSYGNFEWFWFGVKTHYFRFVASEYANGHAEWLAQQYAEAYGRTPGFWSAPWYVFEYLFYDPHLAATPPTDLPRSRVFPDLSGVIWRTGWEPDALVFALKTGAYGGRFAFDRFVNEEYPWDAPCRITGCQFNFAHNHDDTNGFYIYNAGRWLAPETVGVNKPQTSFHNAILIDGQGQFRPANDEYPRYPSEIAATDGFLEMTSSTPNFDYVAANATQRYRHIEGIETATRHVLFVRPGYFVMLDNLAARNPHQFDWVSHFGQSVTVEERWIRGDAGNNQILGVGVVSPEAFETTVGDDGRPYVHLRPATPVERTRFINILLPTNTAEWQTRPAFQLLADTGEAAAIRVQMHGEPGWQDDLLFVYTENASVTANAGPYQFDGRAAVVTRDNAGEMKRIFITGGAFLTDNEQGRELVSGLDASAPFEATFEGSTLVIPSHLRSNVKIYAPSITHVTVAGASRAFTRSGDYITIEGSKYLYLPQIQHPGPNPREMPMQLPLAYPWPLALSMLWQAGKKNNYRCHPHLQEGVRHDHEFERHFCPPPGGGPEQVPEEGVSMTIVQVNPIQDPRWQHLVERRESSLFHAPAWIDSVAATYGFQPCASLLLDAQGQPTAGIAYCTIADIRGKRMISFPFSDFSDPLVSSEEEWYCLANQIFQDGVPFSIRCLHTQIPLADERLSQVNRAKWHGFSLEPAAGDLWNNLHSSARRAIQKAERDGVEIRRAESTAELRVFYDLHLGVRKHKYRLLAQPYSFFEYLWHAFIEQDKGALFLAHHQDQVIGGTFFLGWKERFYYKFNASAPDMLSLRPNDLLLWKGIEYAKAEGYTYFDFGLSDWDQEGLVRYKRKFASDEREIAFLRYQQNHAPSHEVAEIQRLLPQLTELLTRDDVPDEITEQAGAMLYRFFV